MYTIRILHKVVKQDPKTKKGTVSIKRGSVFSVEATSKANARPLIKERLVQLGFNSFSIVPANAENTYVVYVVA